MKISSFVCSANVTHENDGSTNIISVIPAIKLANLPSNYSFTISVVLVSMKETGGETIRMDILDSDGVLVNHFENFIVPPIPDDFKKSGIPYTVTVNLDIRNMVFKKEGLHTIPVYINEKRVFDYSLEVFVGE